MLLRNLTDGSHAEGIGFHGLSCTLMAIKLITIFCPGTDDLLRRLSVALLRSSSLYKCNDSPQLTAIRLNLQHDDMNIAAAYFTPPPAIVLPTPRHRSTGIRISHWLILLIDPGTHCNIFEPCSAGLCSAGQCSAGLSSANLCPATRSVAV